MTTPNFCGGSNFDIRSAVFNRSVLDRLNNDRRQSTFEHHHLNPFSRVLVFSPSLQILTYTNPSVSIALLPPHLVPLLDSQNQKVQRESPLLILGKDKSNKSYLAVRLDKNFNLEAWLSTVSQQHGPLKFVNLRSAVATLQHDHASMAAQARSLFEFHSRHAFCGTCGSPTVSEQGGTRRRCTKNIEVVEPTSTGDSTKLSNSQHASCDGMWFPRIDPVVIMLILDSTGNQVLLGRQRKFRNGLFSCLAGFMEHGEGVDDAVRREVFEEAGVTVERIRFFGSQAWPFPYSLMLGCIAQATVDASISVDEHELEQARWFTRAEIECMVHRAKNLADRKEVEGLLVPPVTAIAGQMLASYAARDAITCFDLGEAARWQPSPTL